MPKRETVLLVPGLFSPRWHMSGLRRALQRAGFEARTWDDASVFGKLDTSVERLQAAVADSGAAGIVTHSFGDWLLRRAAAENELPSVRALVSLVPVMTSSLAARLLRPLGAIAPEVAVMASDERAGRHLQTPLTMDRLVVWSRLDPWVRRVATDDLDNTRATVVPGTHNTVIWQPGVQRLTAEHLKSVLQHGGNDSRSVGSPG